MHKRLFTILILLTLGACSNGPRPQADTGAAAYEMLGRTSLENSGGYRLSPGDELSINVYYEPEMNFDKVVVDSGGRIPFPYIGFVKAEGLTAEELAQVITKGLANRYVVDPQVSISVLEAASQKLIVEGEVEKPGSYPVKGKSTLLEALAVAGGPKRTAKLDQVIVFRQRTDGVYAARFNLKEIRANAQPNPMLEGGDTVVVGINEASRFYRDILQIAPLLTIIFFRL